jgi:hypothetical protein
MDLLLIVNRIWRHKFVTVPLILLTVVGAAYVVAVKQPVYQVSASYLLVNPPGPPTADQIAANPSLRRVRADNPYTRFGNQPVMTDVLSRTMSSDSARNALMQAGADPRYLVESALAFGDSVPIMQITAHGSTPESATRTADLVSHAMVRELDRLQSSDVDPQYRITAQQLQSPGAPQPQAAGKVRVLVGTLGAGAILLFGVISVADALESIRRTRSAVPADEVSAPDEVVVPDLTWSREQPLASSSRWGRASARQ